MSSGNVFERLFKLWASVCKLVLDGKRAAEEVCCLLQAIVDGKTLVEKQSASDVSGLPNIDWVKVYESLGMSAEYANLIGQLNIKENPMLWTIPVLAGVTCNKIVAALKKLGVKFYLYTEDLNKAVPTNDRDPSNGSYIIGFKRNVEADEENKNLSADELKSRNHKGITLLERLLLELGYFLATEKHLDNENITLCTGSRSSDGDVPRVDWNSVVREVYVDWYYSDNSDDYLRSRSAVSLPV